MCILKVRWEAARSGAEPLAPFENGLASFGRVRLRAIKYRSPGASVSACPHSSAPQ